MNRKSFTHFFLEYFPQHQSLTQEAPQNPCQPVVHFGQYNSELHALHIPLSAGSEALPLDKTEFERTNPGSY
jgi:hypothetical protein